MTDLGGRGKILNPLLSFPTWERATTLHFAIIFIFNEIKKKFGLFGGRDIRCISLHFFAITGDCGFHLFNGCRIFESSVISLYSDIKSSVIGRYSDIRVFGDRSVLRYSSLR